ncbi:FAD-dependent oxidoreductase [Candidatus Peregrinibacteria bacterium]|nr:FAD-dependent oxidoreductase [Candidatus Peregrinibacteria bacterium]
MKSCDFLIIGSGIAGLTAAYSLSDFGSVTVLSKGGLDENNSGLAQGGIAAVRSADDRFKKHIQDTLIAGAKHNRRKAVKFLVKEAPKAIELLQEVGVRFAETPHLEGGHSLPRVWHTGDRTGNSIIQALLKVVRKKKSVTLLAHHEAIELIVKNNRCCGAFIAPSLSLSRAESRGGEGAGGEFLSPFTLLATGGFGQLYGRTTNAAPATGDGLVLALKAGLKLKDLEFIQFHPTALNVHGKGNRYFLISEALRGFGAKVVNRRGEEFLFRVHPNGSLAPRDVVTRAIFFEEERGPVFLDLRHLDPRELRQEFPTISEALKRHRLDPAKHLIPITPVEHYSCGGVPTGLSGETELPGLYAIGEVACTGVQGANRLASNSLLEGVVFAQSAAKDIQKKIKNKKTRPPESALSHAEGKGGRGVCHPAIRASAVAYQKALQKIREIMWENVGIVRTKESLKEAEEEISQIQLKDDRIQGYKALCLEIIHACLARKKSLGAHFMS